MILKGFVVQDTLTGIVDGNNTVFTTSKKFKKNTVRLYLNGLRQERGGDYTETGQSEITFSAAPETGDILVCDFELG